MTVTERRRADVILTERGLFESRSRAQEAIAAGLVRVNGLVLTRPSERIGPDDAITATPVHDYVSRGGLKLAAALAAFGVDPGGRICLDAGASTGGFTEVLLRRGAARVIAVDSGRDQLHARLRGHPAIDLREATDIRALDLGKGQPQPDLAVVDVSFISLKLVLPALACLLAPAAEIVALIKPQFEVGRAAVGKGGIVRDAAAQARAVDEVAAAMEMLGFTTARAIDSPVLGGDGNHEFLIHGRRPA
ncbi:MAG TPA: TlyA family RNA methyltransferase [Beijerinckiaceae bacterium]|nr:TlyA family RNA methyltransferase [Beijerinckiaceae bacterium]